MTARPIAEGQADSIRFVLDGRIVQVDDVEPTRSVLNFLRENLRRTGTKEGCAEGDCGACTVVIAELDADGIGVRTRAVNACLLFVPALDGKALFTVESIRRPDGGLHPAQEAMVACHGSQCGFCTPGFVMSLWGLYVGRPAGAEAPDDRTVRTALSGNLCRCTGYRPIIEAGHRMFELRHAPLDLDALRLQLLGLRREAALEYAAAGHHFFAPRTLAELVALRFEYPQATLLAGNTDVGLWVNKQLRDLGDIIHTGQVAELRVITRFVKAIRIGAAVTLDDAFDALARHYPELTELWERFASPPIRNAGTLGGNVANGSPIGDSMPALIALGATVVLCSPRGQRTLPLEALYLGYQKKAMAPDEVLEAVEVPLAVGDLRFRTFKVSRRYDSDISAVCAAFALRLEGNTVAGCRIAFGGMAPIPKRAANAEAFLTGKAWTEDTALAAGAVLAQDYVPLTDLRASAGYRLKVAQNLLRRFYLETRAVDPLPAAQVSVFAATQAPS